MIESINSVFTPDNVMYIMRGFANTVLFAINNIHFRSEVKYLLIITQDCLLHRINLQ